VLFENYTVRLSKRAKYLRLTISLEKGIVVVVPIAMNNRKIQQIVPQFIKEKQVWLHQAVKKLRASGISARPIDECHLPELIQLKALGQSFSIRYITATLLTDTDLELKMLAEQQLEIRGNLKHKKSIFALLENFFKDYARIFFKQKLDQYSEQFNLPYNRLTIRAQRTRWGSCSAKKNINLNYRLLFIDEELLDYILVHELVHTVQMNHSPAFWSHLEALMADARVRDRQVNQETKNLPCWIFHQ
jgi:predicted metal-dependent hydrolase